MPHHYNSPNLLSTVHKRQIREELALRRARMLEHVSTLREDDFARRRVLAGILQVLGDTSEFLLDNYRVTKDSLDYYGRVLRYRSEEMTCEWVRQCLGHMDYRELLHWVSVRDEIVDHMEDELGLKERAFSNPYTEHWRRVKLENAHLPFLFDSAVVIMKSEHPAHWYLDAEAILRRYPETIERFSREAQGLFYKHLQEYVCGPWPYTPDPHRVRPEELAAYVGDPEIAKMVAQDRDRTVTAVLRQHDKMFGTDFIPRKSTCDRIVAFFKPLFTYRHHEQRND